MLAMRDGAILCNAGHFNVEVDMSWLEKEALAKTVRRDNIVSYELKNGRSVNVLGEGRLVNLAAGDGHPAEIMDMSFALQALSAAYLAKEGRNISGERKTIEVPEAIDREVAERKLAAMGYRVDRLTDAQKTYLGSWAL